MHRRSVPIRIRPVCYRRVAFRGLAMLLAFAGCEADDGFVHGGGHDAGPGPPDAPPCVPIEDNCRSGLRCVDDVCVAMCTLSPDSCDAAATCTNPNDGVAIGPSTDYGVCIE